MNTKTSQEAETLSTKLYETAELFDKGVPLSELAKMCDRSPVTGRGWRANRSIPTTVKRNVAAVLRAKWQEFGAALDSLDEEIAKQR